MRFAKTWTCSACGETMANEPMVVIVHQLKNAERRPLATLVPNRSDRARTGLSEANESEWWIDTDPAARSRVKDRSFTFEIVTTLHHVMTRVRLIQCGGRLCRVS
jgi:hypothetical protein